MPGKDLSIFSSVHDPEPMTNAFDFEVCFVNVPNRWFGIFSSINRLFCGEYPLAYGFVAYVYIEGFFEDFFQATIQCCHLWRRVEFDGECGDAAEEVSSGQVAGPDETKAASSTLVALDSNTIFSVSVEMLSSASFAPGHKRTFFIAKATQVCL